MVLRRITVVLFLTVMVVVSASQKAVAGDTMDVLMRYYKAPKTEVAVRVLKEFDSGFFRNGQRHTGVIVGFCAALFHANPDSIEQYLLPYPRTETALLVGYALTLSGKRNVAIDYLRQSKIHEASIVELSQLPQDIQTFPVTTPLHLDFLWGRVTRRAVVHTLHVFSISSRRA